ncbi:polyphosphate kinase 2 family protein [Leifsonia sp. AG29]|uniref:polyphosphate kinase 2 family protein n=1 Tax=Leifsonia sp. AG29 TaxID=2598860 RepID=UPI0018EED4F0|nr:polyphosphate kinase 2 family protein [Leifsonia sp. AG29]
MGRETYWTEQPDELLHAGKKFTLAGHDTAATPGFAGDKAAGEKALADGGAILAELQSRLYAAGPTGERRSVLLVLQGMDTSGKGGIVTHVIGQMNPGGVSYYGFKAPTSEELGHDFLWRVHRRLPGAGQVGVFDRSHYEDVLIARVRQLALPEEIDRRYRAINDFERNITESGTRIVKVMLHLGKEQQKTRLLDRLDRPEKHWKFHSADVDERLLWDHYQEAYQLMIEHTSTSFAPWYVVPADHKWYARLAVQHLLIAALEALGLEWPTADYDVDIERKKLSAT